VCVCFLLYAFFVLFSISVPPLPGSISGLTVVHFCSCKPHNDCNVSEFPQLLKLKNIFSVTLHKNCFNQIALQCAQMINRLTVTKLYRSNVESDSTILSVVPGPMSSSNRSAILRCFILVLHRLLFPYVTF
jgi:hypothetical protein